MTHLDPTGRPATDVCCCMSPHFHLNRGPKLLNLVLSKHKAVNSSIEGSY